MEIHASPDVTQPYFSLENTPSSRGCSRRTIGAGWFTGKADRLGARVLDYFENAALTALAPAEAMRRKQCGGG